MLPVVPSMLCYTPQFLADVLPVSSPAEESDWQLMVSLFYDTASMYCVSFKLTFCQGHYPEPDRGLRLCLKAELRIPCHIVNVYQQTKVFSFGRGFF